MEHISPKSNIYNGTFVLSKDEKARNNVTSLGVDEDEKTKSTINNRSGVSFNVVDEDEKIKASMGGNNVVTHGNMVCTKY